MGNAFEVDENPAFRKYRGCYVHPIARIGYNI